MSTITKKHKEARAKVDRTKNYLLKEAVGIIKDASYAKFDETVDVAVRLGVDPRHGCDAQRKVQLQSQQGQGRQQEHSAQRLHCGTIACVLSVSSRLKVNWETTTN